MTQTRPEPSARARILETAYRLFYRQGYGATGINQVIAESGVAKATFYRHFPSKEDLGAAYVRERSRRELAEMKEWVDRSKTARARFLAPMAALLPWIEHTNFQGCPFQNIVVEFLAHGHPVHREVGRNRLEFTALFQKLGRELRDSDKRYRNLNPVRLADSYMILMEGAVMLAVIYHDTKPLHHALKEITRLIDQA